MSATSTGQYTKLGGCLVQPALVDALHYADHLAPRILTNAATGYACPSAAAGSVASSRAKSSEITATRPPASMSLQVISRPAIIRVPIASKYPGETNLVRAAAPALPAAASAPDRYACRSSCRPSIGRSLVNPAAATPGSAAILSRISRCMPVYCSVSGIEHGVSGSRSAPFESSPGPKTRGRRRAALGTFGS